MPDLTETRRWWHDAACLGHHELFDTTSEADRDNAHYAAVRARRLCLQCPVAADCLTDALAYEGTSGRDVRHGIRAGLTPVEREEKAKAS